MSFPKQDVFFNPSDRGDDGGIMTFVSDIPPLHVIETGDSRDNQFLQCPSARKPTTMGHVAGDGRSDKYM